jgi:hypothetical protein
MHNSLFRYLEIKMHPMIDEGQYDRISVIGRHDRAATIISTKEKNDKKYNWQRPTADQEGNRLTVCCYPGRDYVRHYASLISTYLALNGKNPDIVEYYYPSEADSWGAVQGIDLSHIPEKNLLIVGYALDSIFGDATWTEGDSFWSSQYVINDQPATLLLVKHSFWGDIAGQVIRKIAESGFQRVLFIGKLGSLRSDHAPNECLATGTASLIEGELVQWNSLFKAPLPDFVKSGIHICVPSVIYETTPWADVARKGFDFVDPEIGHMARESGRSGIAFSYLHVVSDNVIKTFTEDLSNERNDSVVSKRVILKQKIAEVIRSSLGPARNTI